MCAIDIDMQGDEDAAWDLCLHMAENGARGVVCKG